MMLLFEGNKDAHGKFVFDDKVRLDGKVKGTGITLRNPVSMFLWDEHFLGRQQLGIIPITQDSMCRFGAIDIDDYTVDKEALNAKIYKHNLPVVLFRSKSGGAHLFMFVSQFVPAILVQEKLRQIASFLGHGTAEIFPKQTNILKERGDIGQWINMPYFDTAKTTRYAYRAEDNHKMTLKEFIAYADLKKISELDLTQYKTPISDELPHGPPCLQHLTSQGFPDGTRNQGLFNLGVYAQKASPDGWQKLTEEMNQKFMKPPLSPKEVLTTIASLTKKEYNYSCKKTPICEHCNVSICRTRKYGVGENSGMPTLGTLTKLDSDPPIWFIDIEGGGRLELSTDDLQNPLRFQRRCLEVMNMMPTLPRRQDWQVIVTTLLEGITVVPVAKEATPTGQLLLHLEDFCVNRVGGDEAECMIRGLVWNNDGHHHFRLTDFVQYLERKKFTEFRLNKITSVLRDYHAVTKGVNVVKGKYINTICIPYFKQDITKFIPPTQVDKDDVPY